MTDCKPSRIPKADHPIWGIARLVVLMLALWATLWTNASNFDSTEIRSIVTMFLVAAGAEAIPKMIGGKT